MQWNCDWQSENLETHIFATRKLLTIPPPWTFRWQLIRKYHIEYEICSGPVHCKHFSINCCCLVVMCSLLFYDYIAKGKVWCSKVCTQMHVLAGILICCALFLDYCSLCFSSFIEEFSRLQMDFPAIGDVTACPPPVPDTVSTTYDCIGSFYYLLISGKYFQD